MAGGSALVVNAEALAGAVERPLFRDDQLRELRACLGKEAPWPQPIHFWVHGPPGTGKTLCVRHLLARECPSSGVRGFYLNCRERFSAFSVVAGLLDVLQPLRSQVRSWDVQVDLLKRSLGAERAVVALDEFDALRLPEAADLLHALCGIPKVAVLCIASSRERLLDLPDPVRSRFAPRQVLFPRFQPEELAAIVQEVARRALRAGALTPGALEKIVEQGYGDARRAIALLRHTVLRAEECGDRVIRADHLVPANFEHFHASAEETLAALGSHHRLLYDLVKAAPGIASGELERQYQEACQGRGMEPAAPRTFTKYLGQLVDLGLLDRERGVGAFGWVYRLAG